MTDQLALSKRRTRVPICATCGRRLSRYDDSRSHRNVELSAGNLHKSDVETPDFLPAFTADGASPTRGAYGDNLVCSQVCGHLLAVRLVAALGIEVLRLLPEPWRNR